MIRQRKPLRSVSPALRALNAIYNDVVAAWKQKPENWHCCVPGCPNFAEDCHHQRGRTQQLLLNQAFYLPVCRPHHAAIKDHPKWAIETIVFAGTLREMPLLASGRKWNTSPPFSTPR